MDYNKAFGDFLTNSSSEIDITSFIINFILTAIIIHFVAFVYVKYGKAISNRRVFSNNLILISMITMLIITVVKSSLALSLGLVGALSIVRFRTPIKEPEELVYLFLSIAIGLGFGAGQRTTTIIGAILILVIILFISKKEYKSTSEHDIYLSIRSDSASKNLLDDIMDKFQEQQCKVNLKRIDESNNYLKVDFVITFDNYDHLSQIKKKLMELDKDMSISVIDNRLLQ